ncbi:MAG: 23S rRNA (uracil(1939)-C(5))-methyltransferase RlmD [Bacteroidales bacterium]|nr:23S rRNA (uracil(1939)-C(5))-methyltransferase RlmD [Bacteroidales bacterium]
MKKRTLIENVEITDVAAEGKALFRHEDRVVFVTGAVPGDFADVEITKKRSSYWEGKVTRIVTPSPVRIEPRCPEFGLCGGCKWQHLPYEEQLKYKQREVVSNLTRLGHLTLPQEETIAASANQYEYRNKLEYTFSNRRWLTGEEVGENRRRAEAGEPQLEMRCAGFHVPGLFDKVVNIDKCHLQPYPSNEIRNFIRDWGLENNLDFYDLREQHGFLRTLIIRTSSTGEIMVILTLGREEKANREKLLSALKEKFPEITSLLYVINEKHNDTITDQEICVFSGQDYIMEQMGDVKYKVGPKSFYQTNSAQAQRLYEITRDKAHLTGNEVVYDLYTGTGTIANFVARQCKKVVGIEYVPEAIEDAKVNSQINNITNTEFFAGDMKDVLTADFIAKHGRPDVMIVDPPRAGMHPDVVKTILDAAPARIVYVSCNSATQARDLQMMAHAYRVVSLRAVDMFPQTHHVESVVELELIPESERTQE